MAILYDQFGREITVKKRPETREVAVAAVRDRWSSYPAGGLTPVKLATIFKQADGGDVYRQAELFEEMEEKDTHLFSQLQIASIRGKRPRLMTMCHKPRFSQSSINSSASSSLSGTLTPFRKSRRS